MSNRRRPNDKKNTNKNATYSTQEKALKRLVDSHKNKDRETDLGV